jgi:hypothetical protein
MTFAYAYIPPEGMEPLPAPSVGATGHFSHHEALDEKINTLSAHIDTQVGILTGALSAEFDLIEAPVLDYEAAIAAVQAAADNAVSTAGAALPKGGGTMTGDIAMNGHTISGLAAADAAGEAVRYEQLAGKLDAGRVAGGKVEATTDGNGVITFAIATSPTGNWAVTCTNANTDISQTNGLPHISVTAASSTSVTVRCANSSDPAKAAQANKAIKFYYTAVAY